MTDITAQQHAVTSNKKDLTVTKRSGEVNLLDYEKIHSMIDWACEGLRDVSASQVATSANLQFYDKMTTKVIHDTLIQSAVNLITEDATDYQYVAARLLLVNLRKEAYGDYTPTPLFDQIKKCVQSKKYAADLLTTYSEEEISKIEKIINYDRDLNFTYAGLREFAESYLVRDKTKGLLFETPQQAYIVIAMTIFSVEDVAETLFETSAQKKAKRLLLIKELYDALSQFKISLPTPIMANCRTTVKQFASCTLIDCGDSIESIFTTSHAIGRYITRGAGIGLNMGRLRGDGSSTKEGLGFSTGCIPFYKLMESATNSCSQGGIRKGASAVFYPFWHTQVEDLIPLKDNRGTSDNRVRHLDYSVQLNKVFYDRIKANSTIALFCPADVPDLYQAFFQDTAKFEELYLKYEAKKSLKKKIVKAKDLLDLIVRVRSETGRLYIHNVDNSNDYGSFIPEKATVYQSNLCVAGDTYIYIEHESLELKGSNCVIEIKNLQQYLDAGKTYVRSYNTETKKEEYKLITAFAKTNPKAQVLELRTEEGHRLVLTPDHKVYVDTKGYVEASKLEVGDILITLVGKTAVKELTPLDKEIPVYDITVEDNHNFFAAGILAHNCSEILLPTVPLTHIDDEKGLIALCTLGAVNLGKLKHTSDMEGLTRILVRALDNLLDYQQYPIKAAERFGRDFRSLGVGVSGLAHYLAKNGLKYASEGTLDLVHEMAEALQYYLLKASNELAKERGKCREFETTKYSQGILPIDKYKKAVDKFCTTPLKLDWEALREAIKQDGLRHTVLSAQMPVEKSSIVGNSTNGIEAPRALLSIKNNKNSGSIPIVVPEFSKLKKYYQLTWDDDYSNAAYLNIAAVIQKFLDQSISSDLYYNPSRYYERLDGDSEAVSREMYKDIVRDIFSAYAKGVKTLYYHTTRDGSGESFKKHDTYVEEVKTLDPEEESCPGGVCTL